MVSYSTSSDGIKTVSPEHVQRQGQVKQKSEGKGLQVQVLTSHSILQTEHHKLKKKENQQLHSTKKEHPDHEKQTPHSVASTHPSVVSLEDGSIYEEGNDNQDAEELKQQDEEVQRPSTPPPTSAPVLSNDNDISIRQRSGSPRNNRHDEHDNEVLPSVSSPIVDSTPVAIDPNFPYSPDSAVSHDMDRPLRYVLSNSSSKFKSPQEYEEEVSDEDDSSSSSSSSTVSLAKYSSPIGKGGLDFDATTPHSYGYDSDTIANSGYAASVSEATHSEWSTGGFDDTSCNVKNGKEPGMTTHLDVEKGGTQRNKPSLSSRNNRHNRHLTHPIPSSPPLPNKRSTGEYDLGEAVLPIRTNIRTSRPSNNNNDDTQDNEEMKTVKSAVSFTSIRKWRHTRRQKRIEKNEKEKADRTTEFRQFLGWTNSTNTKNQNTEKDGHSSKNRRKKSQNKKNNAEHFQESRLNTSGDTNALVVAAKSRRNHNHPQSPQALFPEQSSKGPWIFIEDNEDVSTIHDSRVFDIEQYSIREEEAESGRHKMETAHSNSDVNGSLNSRQKSKDVKCADRSRQEWLFIAMITASVITLVVLVIIVIVQRN